MLSVKFEEAIKAYDEAIRLDPKLAIAWYNKGVALGDLGKYDEAIEAYDEAIRLDPNYATAWTTKALLSAARTSTMKPSKPVIRPSG